MSADAGGIVLPIGVDIRLCFAGPASFVLVAPPGTKADLDMLSRPGVPGLFTHDPGLAWPDPRGCAAASLYLSSGHPIALRFELLAGALTCHALIKALVH